MALSKREVLVATMLAIVAITAIAYAQAVMGTVTITTDEVVQSIPGGTFIFPARSAGSVSLGNIVLNFSKGNLVAGSSVRIRVELAVDDANIYEGFRSLVVKVTDGSTVKAILTLSTPYDEFTITVPNPNTQQVTLPVELIYATGEKPISHATFRLLVTIVGVE
jgi:hypothetical protein